MERNCSYVYVGQRPYILRYMVGKSMNLKKVWVINNSFLHNELLKDKFVEYEVVFNKEQLINNIKNEDFDVLISSGCKYIIPISAIMKNAKYINIHPSFLPDLKGKNPINGAFLYERDAGATCHIMDDGIDTGAIISQIKIPLSDDLDADLLYRLCFDAEVLAFEEALKRDFEPVPIQPQIDNPIYFTASEKDFYINFEKGFDYIIKQVKAFGCKSKGVFFKCFGKQFRFYKASEITNEYVTNRYKDYKELCVLMSYENTILFKFENRMLKFECIENGNDIKIGDILE